MTGPATSPVTDLATGLASNSPVRIGVLGCAEIARRRMLPAFAADPGTELVAVASRELPKAEETARPYGCRAVLGYEALLADPSVDAVYVPLPAALHDRWTRAALEAGKHVLAEKPLTLDPGRTAALFALARRRGLALMENVMFTQHPQHEAVRQLVADGALGELRTFHAEFSIPRRPPGDIRYQPELGGGALWDTGVYPLRAALHLLGPDLTLLAAHLSDPAGLGAPSAGTALLLHRPTAVTATLAFGLDHAYRSTYTLTGARAHLTLPHAFTPPADHPPTLLPDFPAPPPADPVARTVAAFAADPGTELVAVAS
ncbi:MAG: dTDP-3,4-didehydro-2,6-dideoxy-alpha-D-glucose 3-reductase, partial [Streptomyces sp.]|nr:dTDP-3,4-didehydro-2,6-dideoxy-alpha-D-glucose 3-reductase [Streptomyces sp.]